MFDLSRLVPEARNVAQAVAEVYWRHTQPWFVGLICFGSAVRSDKSLRVGMIVTINRTTRRIIALANDYDSMTMDGPISAAGPGLSIAYSPPVFKDFGAIAP